MYAIVEIAGQQYKVEKDQQIFVHRLEGKEGSKVTFDNVLLTSDGDKIEVGAPAVQGVSVSAKIIEHLKGDKVIVFKKKRRKGYKVRNGHRQYLSKIEISSIGKATKAAPKTAAKKVEAPKVDAKPAAAKAEAKKPAAKKAAAPKAEVKKPAAKKEDKKED
jgi:large subunit ribosomal protein L21